MLFSSLVFIWYFLPIVCLLSLCLPGLRLKNLLLFLASLFFYAWGEPVYIVLMILSILVNYLFGLWISAAGSARLRRGLLIFCTACNLGVLGYYKYFNFLAGLVDHAAGCELIPLREIALPIGISFYTFQMLSYIVDVYRGTITAQRDLLSLGLYISFFPQLIAGPIVKYHDIERQLTERVCTADKMAVGIKRFCFGLGKKVILSNTFAAVVDNVLAAANLGLASRKLLWLTMLLYSLQIYFDFSGYSDMAIGLGKMFGFDFMENFRYPYLSRSIREFWRRWHISLSTWFQEYLYIPLGGNRRGAAVTYRNLFLVFLATGIWHGAGVNFLLWGIWHGTFIVLERLFLGRLLDRNPVKILNHLYAMAVVYLGWILFRVEDFGQIRHMLRVMFGGGGVYGISMFADRRVFFWLAVGLLLCGPLQAVCRPFREWLYDEERIRLVDVAVMALLLCACTMLLVSSTYNPFIYFRF